MLTFAIIGLGNRGSTYGNYIFSFRKDCKVVAICDIDEAKLSFYKEKYSIDKSKAFSCQEDFFKAGILADVLIIATPDSCHHNQAISALNLGYNLLLEKPISPHEEECKEIEQLSINKSKQVIVCHVLRYTTFYRKIKELIDSNILGKLVHISSTENVGFWHQAHSFVRGNWRNNKEAPMILAKCCHDMDLLNWIIGKKPISVSSYGDLSLFKKENAPEKSSRRCRICKVSKTCPYNAYKLYVDKINENNITGWPYDVLCLNPTKEKIIEALDKGPYGRCVYRCDNNVVDHQIVNILYEDDITASHTMVAFSKDCYRTMHLYCTLGEIIADGGNSTITYYKFLNNEKTVIDVRSLESNSTGHMGGDTVMVDEMIEKFKNNVANFDSSISKSVSSHLICLTAEKSRKAKGKNLKIM